jgi:hypothetical protein
VLFLTATVIVMFWLSYQIGKLAGAVEILKVCVG